jgi:hypothetical protein
MASNGRMISETLMGSDLEGMDFSIVFLSYVTRVEHRHPVKWVDAWATYCSPAVCGLVTHGLQRLRLTMNTLIKGTAFSGRDSNLTSHPTRIRARKVTARVILYRRLVCLLYSLYSKTNCCRVQFRRH